MTYEQFYGLSLNLGRIRGRMAHAVFQGLSAQNASRIPAWFFECVASGPEDAEDIAFDVNAAKTFARAAR